MSFEESRAKFYEMEKDPEFYVNYEGPTAEFRCQIAIKTKQLLISRDFRGEGNQYSIADKEKKNATQEDVDEAYLKTFTNVDSASKATNANSTRDNMKYRTIC